MLFALTFLIQFSNKKQNKNLNFDTSDIHLLQILCNFVQSIFNIKYDTWYIFLFLFFKSQLIRRILRYMKLQRIKWSVQWIIYSDMEIEEKKQEHVNCTRKISEVSISTHLICSSRTHCTILKIPRRKPFHWDTWTIIE